MDQVWEQKEAQVAIHPISSYHSLLLHVGVASADRDVCYKQISEEQLKVLESEQQLICQRCYPHHTQPHTARAFLRAPGVGAAATAGSTNSKKTLKTQHFPKAAKHTTGQPGHKGKEA